MAIVKDGEVLEIDSFYDEFGSVSVVLSALMHRACIFDLIEDL